MPQVEPVEPAVLDDLLGQPLPEAGTPRGGARVPGDDRQSLWTISRLFPSLSRGIGKIRRRAAHLGPGSLAAPGRP